MNIWLSGYFGHENLGDEAILASVLRSLPVDACPNVLSWNGKKIQDIHQGVRCFPPPPHGFLNNIKYCLKNGYKVFPQLFSHRPLIIAGGGCLNDHVPGRVVKRLQEIKKLKKLGCEIGFLGVGVNDFVEKDDILALREMFQHYITYCSVRDSGSRAALSLAGVDASKVWTTTDLVFSLYEKKIRNSDFTKNINNACIGVNLRPLFDIDKERGEDKEHLKNKYSLLATDLLKRLKLVVRSVDLVPLSPDDYFFLSELAKDSGVTISPVVIDPYSAIDKFSKYDAFIGMRYHAVLFSLLSGVSCVPIPYSQKVVNLSIEFGIYDKKLVVGDGSEVDKSLFTVDSVVENLLLRFASRSKDLKNFEELCRQKSIVAKNDIHRCSKTLTLGSR